MRDRLRRLGQWLGWMSASGLLAISLSALAYGHFLQAELDRAFALGMAQNALAAPLEQGDEAALREVTRALFEHAGLGFRYIAVRGEATDLGASYGRYENLSLPLVSAALRHRLRDALYRLTSVGGQHRIQRDGQVIGTLDYAISRDFRDSVESDAVRRLRTVGLAGTALSLPLLISLWLQLRARAGAAKTDPLRQRLMARSTGEPSLAPRGRGDVGRLDGEQLDRLGLAQIVADPEGRILSLNRTAESLCGWSADDVERRPVYTVFHAVDGAGRPAPVPLETVLRDGVDLAPHAGFLKPRQGQPLPVQMMASVIHNADGMVVGAVQVFHDRSLQAAAEADSARRQARAEAVLDALEDGVLITDEAGVIRASNRRARELFGYPPTQLEGGTVTKLMPVPFLNTPGIRLDDFVAPTPDLPRVVGWRRDASTFPVDLRVRPLQTHDGALRMVSWADENGFPLCVASNGERPNVLESLRIAELDTYLPPERTFTADQDEVAKGKPAPDLFLYAASQTGGHDPARCLVIEDTTVGVRAAKAASMTVFGLTSSHANIPGYDDRLREAGADAIMESWADFPAQIKDA